MVSSQQSAVSCQLLVFGFWFLAAARGRPIFLVRETHPAFLRTTRFIRQNIIVGA
jgi:hypothetical protein